MGGGGQCIGIVSSGLECAARQQYYCAFHLRSLPHWNSGDIRAEIRRVIAIPCNFRLCWGISFFPQIESLDLRQIGGEIQNSGVALWLW